MIDKNALDFIPDREAARAFKQALAKALKGIPTLRFTLPTLIDGEFQVRHATIRKDIKEPHLILVSFYAIEHFKHL